MIQQFEKISENNFKRINAVEPDTLEDYSHDNNKPYVCDTSQKIFPNCNNCKKETCVLISHCEAIKAGKEDGNEWFVICEDDINISQFKIDWEQLLRYLPSDAECIQMLCSNP